MYSESGLIEEDKKEEKLVLDKPTEPKPANSKPAHIWILLGVIALIVAIVVLFYGADELSSYDWSSLIGPEFLLFVLGGFIAQMIDGSLGMAYGLSASTFLLSFG